MILPKTTESPHQNTHIIQPTRLLLLSVAALAIAACQNKIPPDEEHAEIRKAKIASTIEGVSTKPQPKTQKLKTDTPLSENWFQFDHITAEIQETLESDEKSRSMYIVMIELQKKLEKLYPKSQIKVDVQLWPLTRVENGISYVTFSIKIDEKNHHARLVAKDTILTGKDNDTLPLDALHFARQISTEMRQTYTSYLQQKVYGIAATLTESDDSDDFVRKLMEMFSEEKEALAKHGLEIWTDFTMRKNARWELLINIPATDKTIGKWDISFILGTGLLVWEPTKK